MWLRGFSCEALVLLVLHSPGEAHGRGALWCKGDWASGAENHTAVEKIPGSLGYFSVPFLSAIYNDTGQSTFPPLQPLPALHQPLVKLWWLQSHFLDWLSLGSVEVQQPPHLHLPVWHWDTAWAFTWRREKKIKSRWNCRAAPDGQKSQGCFCRLQQARPNRNQEIITASSSLASKLVFYSIFKFEGELFRFFFFLCINQHHLAWKYVFQKHHKIQTTKASL